MVAEVTNTPWGERHAYVLPVDGDDGMLRAEFAKGFHVSPFTADGHALPLVQPPPGERLGSASRTTADGANVFDATLSLQRQPLDAPRAAPPAAGALPAG